MHMEDSEFPMKSVFVHGSVPLFYLGAEKQNKESAIL